jgi:hypothetical protein
MEMRFSPLTYARPLIASTDLPGWPGACRMPLLCSCGM